jgi:Zn-dependent protease/CBS domain-containing protein
MFGKQIRLFTLLGFEVKIDWSWLIIAWLVVWSLSQGLFPYLYPFLPKETYWWMAGVGAVGLFASIIFHEFCHSLVARNFGLPMKGITLFIFGGVAEMGDEPPTAWSEFMMAVVGPLSSFLLALVFYLLGFLAREDAWGVPVTGVIRYLAYVNALLAGFNLLPAFPLDGGRILRSILWGWKNNLKWATQISAQIGNAFGIGLIVLGLFQALQGNFLGGMWWFLIGMYLKGAAQMSFQQMMIRRGLEGEPVRRFMNPHPVAVPPELTVKQLVEDYMYHYHYKMFPVVDHDRLVGYITSRQIKQIPREDWPTQTIASLAEQNAEETLIAPDTDATKALALMNQTGESRLLVVDQGRLVGLVTLKDLLSFLSLKVELED